jgi:HSP20 family protein
MTFIRWQPWREIESLGYQFDQILEALAPTFDGVTHQGQATHERATQSWLPAIELHTTPTAIILRVALPGVQAKDLDVQVTREAVAIAGVYSPQTQTNDAHYLRSEFCYGRFRRVVNLPAPVKNDAVDFGFRNGILTLTLPRLEAHRPKVVKLNLAAGQPISQISPEAEPVSPSTVLDSVPDAQGSPEVEPASLAQALTTPTDLEDVWAENVA